MQRVASRLYAWVEGRRALVALLLLVATGAMGAGMARLKFDNSYEIWFVDGDPALVAYDEFIDLFGSDEALIVLVEAASGDPMDAGDLRVVERLSEALGKLDNVHDVWSLTHMEALEDAGGALEVKRLVDEIPPSAERVKHVRELVASSPLYAPLISKTGKASSIILHLEHTEGSFDPKAKLVRDVRRLSAELSEGRKHWITGGAAFDEAVYRHSEEDSIKYAPLMGLVIAVALGFLFRSVAAVVLPFLVVVFANVWSLGFMGWVGFDANILTTILPPILAAVGIADSVHLLQQLRLQARRGAGRDEAVRQSFVHVLRPCLITSLTTSAGMLSLLVAYLQAIREFGVSVALGVTAAFVLTMFALPLAMLVVPERWLGGLLGEGEDPSPQWLGGWVDFSLRNRRAVLALSLLAVVISGFGMARLTVGASMVSYFYEDDPVFVESLVIDEALGGSYPYEILVRAKEPDDDLLDPEDLATIEEIAQYMSTVPATGQPYSGVDFLKEARRVLLGEPPSKLALPASRQEAAQILLLIEGDGDMGRFLSDDHRTARIEAPIEGGAYEEVNKHRLEIERRITEIAGGRFDAEVTGLSRLMGAVEEYLLDSQIRSFALAFVLVLGFIAAFFRSVRAGLLSAIPNLLPLVLTVGVMGWTGVRLDMTTVLLAPLLLGIVVDDTVHVMDRVLGARSQGATVEDAFRESVVEVGHAVIMTSVILAFGFLTPAFGSFKPNLAFSLLSVLAISLAVLADLIVFPAVSSLWPGMVPGGPARR